MGNKVSELSLGGIVQLLLSDKELLCPKCQNGELETQLIEYASASELEITYLKLGCSNPKCNFSKEWGDIEC